jgi:hypothetical protein
MDSDAVDDATRLEPALEAIVAAMDVDELRGFVMTLAQRDGEVRRKLEVRAAAASGEDTTAKPSSKPTCEKPAVHTYRSLLKLAAALDRADTERA